MNEKYAFISYSSSDFASALEIKVMLDSNDIPCWMASQSISDGGNYESEVPKAIENCGAFILILSQEAQHSHWVSEELEQALACGKSVIPYRIDDYGITAAFSSRLANFPRIEAFGRSIPASEELLRRLKTLWNIPTGAAGGNDQPMPPIDPVVSEPPPAVPGGERDVPPGTGGNGRRYLLLAVVLALLALAAFLLFRHKHTWTPSTCTQPRTCLDCGETEGVPMGHSWQAASCTQARSCILCGATDGAPLGHTWQAATCTQEKVCTVCGLAGGAPLGHTWQAATCTQEKVCTICGATDGTPLGHNWQAATCTQPKTCSVCGATDGSPQDHSWQAATCTQPKTCSVCGITDGGAAGHDWTATDPKTCRRCGATAGSTASGVSLGNIVTLGYYGGETVEWIVLDYDPGTNRYLLISRYCLDAVPFNTGNRYTTWEHSSLRKWLNNDFFNAAFTQDERALIASVQVSAPDNPEYGIDSGNATTDRVFLLSYEEALRYFPTDASRQGAPTAYCKARGCYDPVKDSAERGEQCAPEAVGYTWWWLRTAGLDEFHACNVVSKGMASPYGAFQDSSQGGVRPAMWVTLG